MGSDEGASEAVNCSMGSGGVVGDTVCDQTGSCGGLGLDKGPTKNAQSCAPAIKYSCYDMYRSLRPRVCRWSIGWSIEQSPSSRPPRVVERLGTGANGRALKRFFARFACRWRLYALRLLLWLRAPACWDCAPRFGSIPRCLRSIERPRLDGCRSGARPLCAFVLTCT